MEEKRDVYCKFHYNLYAGSMYAYLALTQIPMLFSYMLRGSSTEILVNFISVFACILLSVTLFTNNRNLIPCIGFFLMAFFPATGIATSNDFFTLFSYKIILTARAIPVLLPVLLIFIGYILLLLFSMSQFLIIQGRKKTINKEFWFIPVICAAIAVVCFVVQDWKLFLGISWEALGSVIYNLMRTTILGIVEIGGVFFASLWILFPEGFVLKKKVKETTIIAKRYETSSIPVSAYCKMSKHVLLLIFTFGIWYLIWIYRTTDYLNVVSEEKKRDPLKKLLLCIFIPFYAIYWTYKSAQRIDILSRRGGIASDCTMLCLIMAIFIPIAAPIIMQDKINNIAMSNQNNRILQNMDVNIANELKIYKELLDNGTITQKEFEEKKKNLLNI